jgi:hypothetical protein
VFNPLVMNGRNTAYADMKSQVQANERVAGRSQGKQAEPRYDVRESEAPRFERPSRFSSQAAPASGFSARDNVSQNAEVETLTPDAPPDFPAPTGRKRQPNAAA